MLVIQLKNNHNKYITIPECNKLTAEVFDARLARAVFVTDFGIRLISLNKKVNSIKKKHLLVENELKKL